MKLPLISKIVLGGAGSALLGIATLGSAPVASAFDAAPAAQVSQAAKPDHKGDRKQDRRLIQEAVFEAEADALGMKPEGLREALRNGKSIEQLAQERGLTKDQVVDRTVKSLRPALDKLVDEKKITREQADRVLDRIQKGHLPGWHHHKKGEKKGQKKGGATQ